MEDVIYIIYQYAVGRFLVAQKSLHATHFRLHFLNCIAKMLSNDTGYGTNFIIFRANLPPLNKCPISQKRHANLLTTSPFFAHTNLLFCLHPLLSTKTCLHKSKMTRHFLFLSPFFAYICVFTKYVNHFRFHFSKKNDKNVYKSF